MKRGREREGGGEREGKRGRDEEREGERDDKEHEGSIRV